MSDTSMGKYKHNPRLRLSDTAPVSLSSKAINEFRKDSGKAMNYVLYWSYLFMVIKWSSARERGPELDFVFIIFFNGHHGLHILHRML
jgi:hypothetical protein